ncbi:unnamed protein product [Auanema sp. JU1783]|nr:unnamed protein product [Auanema sp. JU1783]
MSISSTVTCTLFLSFITYSYCISCFGGKRTLKSAANFDTYDCPSFSLCFSHITFAKEVDAVISKGCTNPDQNVTMSTTKICALNSSFKNSEEDDRQCYCDTDFCNEAPRSTGYIFTAFLMLFSTFLMNATFL